MIRLTLADEYQSLDELQDALGVIAGLLGQGFTSGRYPDWTLAGEEEPRCISCGQNPGHNDVAAACYECDAPWIEED